MPRHCGDFGEALHAFEVGAERVDLERITGYAARIGAATTKRLGWVLEQLGIEDSIVDNLSCVPSSGYHKLDPSGPDRGTHNRRWMILENLPGTVGK